MVTSLSLFAVLAFLKRAGRPALLLLPALAFAPVAPACGDIISTGSSLVFTGSNATGLSARATFTVDPGDAGVLRLLLENTSRSPTMSPAELLTSFYFNVFSGTPGGATAPLSYQSATGQVYLADQKSTDRPATYTPPMKSGTASFTFPKDPVPSNLQAFEKNDDTWQFRSGLSLLAAQQPLAFGVGTVGNADLKPNGFTGSVVGGFNFGIAVGDATTQNLDATPVVRDSIRFAFLGFKGSTLSQVSRSVAFGFGTSPETIIVVPEPATVWLAVVGLLAALAVRAAPRSLLTAGAVSIAALSLLLALPPSR